MLFPRQPRQPRRWVPVHQPLSRIGDEEGVAETGEEIEHSELVHLFTKLILPTFLLAVLEEEEEIHPQTGQLQEDTPDEGSIDLGGDGVILEGRDMAEDVRQEEVDQGDDDGRKVLEKHREDQIVSTPLSL